MHSFDRYAENLVAEALVRRGCRILCRNTRGVGYEIDVAAVKGESLFIVEVKYRRSVPARLEELLPHRKKRSLIRGAKAICQRYFNSDIPSVRFDLALVTGPSLKSLELQYFASIFECFDA